MYTYKKTQPVAGVILLLMQVLTDSSLCLLCSGCWGHLNQGTRSCGEEAAFSKTVHRLPVGLLLAKLNCNEKLPC